MFSSTAGKQRILVGSDRKGFEQSLEELRAILKLELGRTQIDQLYRHYELLRRWNEKMSLTAIRDGKQVVFRHFGESLAVAKVIGDGTGSVVDIGSGGGFPGLPIAVYWPARKVFVVESVGKKAAFLKEVAREMGNVTVFEGRFEKFDTRCEWATLRGVAAEGVRAHLPAVASRAVFVSRRGQELPWLAGVESYALPWDQRTIVVAAQVPRGTKQALS